MRNGSGRHVWLNSVSLEDADASIVVYRCVEPDIDMPVEYGDRLGGDGQVLLSRRRKSKKVQVQFRIRGFNNLVKRAEVLDAVSAWANPGGALEISERPGKRLNVVCVKLAQRSSGRKLADIYELEFETTAIPYWENATQTRFTLSGEGETDSNITIPGSAPTVLDVAFEAESAIDSLTISITGNDAKTSSMTFEVGTAAGDTITIGHDANGILSAVRHDSINDADIDILPYRTAESSDDLTVSGGIASLSVSPEFEGNATGIAWSASVTTRGRWL